ncbi:hypothetical protein [Mycolicibacterium canariasense]|uniref:hypothetical protein n=1 Tax=Mycolicibacterium canariasense TaxID=228230 RepID=UPI0032D574BE
MFVLIMVIGLLAGGGDSEPSSPGAKPNNTYSAAQIESTVIETCQDSARKSLRDPDSAKFDGWKAWPAPNSTPPPDMPFNAAAGDKYYSAAGTVNAKNGFGGYAGPEPYSCEATVSASGNINARAHSIADALETLTPGG